MRFNLPFRIMLTILALAPRIWPQSQAELSKFTGAHTRVVWIQHQGDGSDVWCSSSESKIMGYDSKDGEKEITTTLGHYAAPCFTHDGNRVVYYYDDNEAWIINWDGTNPRFIGRGSLTDVGWDSSTGIEWAYIADDWTNPAKPVWRTNIDDTTQREVAWDNEIGFSSFTVSGDCKRAGGNLPWPCAGLANLENGTWQCWENGCEPAIAPDNSYYVWVFQSTHRHVKLYDSTGALHSTVDIHSADGIKGWEVCHLGWSNHRRYMCMTGPYSGGNTGWCESGNCGDHRGEGGTNVEVYIGRFDSSLTKIEAWFQVSNNNKGDFGPDVWISPSDTNSDTGTACIRIQQKRLSMARHPVLNGVYDILGRSIHISHPNLKSLNFGITKSSIKQNLRKTNFGHLGIVFTGILKQNQKAVFQRFVIIQ